MSLLILLFSVWMCSFSLSVSIGSAALLPLSVIGSEVLHNHPNDYYLKWLNLALINALWKYVFLLSNLSMFVLLPFAYFFIESQGFSFYLRSQRHRPQFILRVYETLVVCFLVIIVLVGIIDVFYSIFLPDLYTISFSLLCISCLSTPILYSFVSLLGVFMLLISTPVGLARMFDLFSEMLIQQKKKSPFAISSSDEYDSNDINTSTNTSTSDRFQASPFFTTPQKLQQLSCMRQQSLRSRLSVSQVPLTRSNSFSFSAIDSSPIMNGGSVGISSNQFQYQCNGLKSSIKFPIVTKIRLREKLRSMTRPVVLLIDYLKYPILMLILLILTVFLYLYCHICIVIILGIFSRYGHDKCPSITFRVSSLAWLY